MSCKPKEVVNNRLVQEVIVATPKYKPRMCWSNAVEALLTSGHPALEGAVYVEGFAIPDGLDVAVEHGWIRLASGEVLELTWPDSSGQYFSGVEYTKKYLAELDPDFLPIVWRTSGPGGFYSAAYRESYYNAVAAASNGEVHDAKR